MNWSNNPTFSIDNNDEPQVVGVVPTVLSTEDSGGESVDLSGVFGDVDIATNGDSLTLTVTGTTGTVLSSACSSLLLRPS